MGTPNQPLDYDNSDLDRWATEARNPAAAMTLIARLKENP